MTEDQLAKDLLITMIKSYIAANPSAGGVGPGVVAAWYPHAKRIAKEIEDATGSDSSRGEAHVYIPEN